MKRQSKKQRPLTVGLQAIWSKVWNRSRRAIPRLARAIPVTGLITIALNSVGLVHRLELPVQDALMRIKSWPRDSDVAIVRITNEDYQALFEGKSPLDPERLGQIIAAIAKGGPRRIGVDIDTSGPQFQALQRVAPGPPIVWAREGTYSNIDGKFYLTDVLGTRSPASDSGLVQLKVDADGVERRYNRVYETDEGVFPSFTWLLARAFFDPKVSVLGESSDERLIDYKGDPKHSYRIDVPASEIMALSRSEDWKTDSVIKDKIVLLGGSYAAQDEHSTPLGWICGVDVLAQIVETDLNGGGVHPPGEFIFTALIALAGLLLWVLFYEFRFIKAFLLSVAAIPAISVLFGVIAFKSVAQFVFFIPILFAVLGEQLYEHYKHSLKGELSQSTKPKTHSQE